MAAEGGQTRIAVKFAMVQEPLSIEDKLRLLQDVGFDGVELDVRQHAKEAKAFAQASDKTGFRIHGVVNSSEPEITRAVDLASAVGGDSVLVLARHDKTQSFEENFKHWQGLVRKAIPTAREKQVRLLIENVRDTFLKTAEDMVRFIDAFEAPDVVGAYYDTGNTITWTDQSAEHWAYVLGQRIGKIDIKDRGHAEFGDSKTASEGVIGTDGGEVHWANVRKELAAIGYDGWATAEVAGGDRERLARMAQWMNGVLRRG